MTEEQTQETNTQEAEPQTESQESQDSLSKEHFDKLRSNFAQEMGTMKNELKQYQARQAEIDKLKAQEEEQRAIEKGDFEKVINTYKDQLSAKDNELTSFRSEVETQKIDTALYRAGLKNEFARIGALTTYNSMEEKPELESFISSLVERSPELFTDDKRHGRSSGTVGIPSNGSTSSLAERLKSKDPTIARAAIRERLEKRARGEAID